MALRAQETGARGGGVGTGVGRVQAGIKHGLQWEQGGWGCLPSLIPTASFNSIHVNFNVFDTATISDHRVVVLHGVAPMGHS